MSERNRYTQTPSPFDLQPLVEFTRTVNSSFDLDFILNNVLFTLMGKLHFTRGIVLLREHGNVFNVAKAKGLQSVKAGERFEFSPVPVEFPHPSELQDYPWYSRFVESGLTHILDLTVRNELIGLIALGKMKGETEFDEREEIFLRSLVNISATAIEKARILIELRDSNRKLDNRIQELNTLFEMSKEFGSIFQRDQLVKILVFSLLGHLGMNRYVIAVKRNDIYDVLASRFPVKDIKQTVLREVMSVEEPLLIIPGENRFTPDTMRCLTENKIAALVPMTLQGETRGIMLLGQRMAAGEYTQPDLEFLYSLANLAMISIENIRLFEETLEKQRLEEELKIAREIQQGLLPKNLPVVQNYQFAARTISSKQVGGDYYDFVKLDNDRYLLVIADVSGKGTPAAMLMSNLQATIRAIAPLEIAIEDATARVNNLIYDNTGADKFITFFWAILDTKRNSLKYVNAGHNPPYLIRSDKSFYRLEKGGMILGVVKDLPVYESELIDIKSGDILVLFTDGITEAMNLQGEEFEEDRLETLLTRVTDKSAEEILQTIVTAVNEFSDVSSQTDDITASILKAL